MKKITISLFAFFTLFMSWNASAVLHQRDGGLLYDDVLDITWTQDANLCVTLNNCINDNGFGGMTQADAQAWTDGLVYQGFSDWRLPTAFDQNGSGPCSGDNCNNSELGHMYYGNIGGTAPENRTGNQTANGIPITGIQNFYWTSTAGTNPGDSWIFFFGEGNQTTGSNAAMFAAWAIRDGDVLSAIPIPAAVWLFLSGLAGIAKFGRRRIA